MYSVIYVALPFVVGLDTTMYKQTYLLRRLCLLQ